MVVDIHALQNSTSRLHRARTNLGSFGTESLQEIVADLRVASHERVRVRTVVLAAGALDEVRAGGHLSRREFVRVWTGGVLTAPVQESKQ